MEGRAQEQPASSGEATSPEKITVSDERVTSTGAAAPYYGCIFCKRGFQTPQALGGHMSLHRAERTRVRVAAQPPLTRVVDWDAYHPYLSGRRHESSARYVVCFSSPWPSFKNPQRPAEWAAATAEKTKGDAKGKESLPKEGLDLELRLGNAWYWST